MFITTCTPMLECFMSVQFPSEIFPTPIESILNLFASKIVAPRMKKKVVDAINAHIMTPCRHAVFVFESEDRMLALFRTFDTRSNSGGLRDILSLSFSGSWKVDFDVFVSTLIETREFLN
jgi:hypothetical protein